MHGYWRKWRSAIFPDLGFSLGCGALWWALLAMFHDLYWEIAPVAASTLDVFGEVLPAWVRWSLGLARVLNDWGTLAIPLPVVALALRGPTRRRVLVFRAGLAVLGSLAGALQYGYFAHVLARFIARS